MKQTPNPPQRKWTPEELEHGKRFRSRLKQLQALRQQAKNLNPSTGRSSQEADDSEVAGRHGPRFPKQEDLQEGSTTPHSKEFADAERARVYALPKQEQLKAFAAMTPELHAEILFGQMADNLNQGVMRENPPYRMEAWVVETFVRGVKIGSWLCESDRATAEELVAIQRIDRMGEPDIRLRTATEEDIAQLHERGNVVELNPNCHDWMLRTSFDGSEWPRVHRHTSLADMLVLARGAADGICSVFLGPATIDEIEQEVRDQTEYERSEAERRRRLWPRTAVGLAVRIILAAVFLYWGLKSVASDRILAAFLLLGGALNAISLLWTLLMWRKR